LSSAFTVSIKAFEDKTGETIKKVMRGITLETFGRVIDRSPVLTGMFKGSWGIQVGSPFSGSGGGIGASTDFSTLFTWNGKGAIYMCNNLPYAVPLEYGHSQQAPKGMVRITAAEMTLVAENIAAGLAK